MINHQFLAYRISFKGEDQTEEQSLPVEIVDIEKGEVIEIAFTIGRERHYLKFPRLEFESAIKDFKRKYRKNK